MVLAQQNIFRLDVSVKNAVPVHVVDTLNQLVHVVLDSVFWQVVAFALNGIVHVHVHELEDKSKSTGGFIAA
jgi:hypothetical protein